MAPASDPSAAVDAAFRVEAGAALATIARLTGDLQVAEDAVQEAYATALQRWPTTGVPDRPGAWITTVARNRALDHLRREGRRDDRERAATIDVLAATEPVLHPVADDQLRLLLTCCHPSLAPETRVALALRFVCGLPTVEIARLLLVGDEAAAKRLQRAKAKIRTNALTLRLPPPHLLPEPIPSVVDTAYLLFTGGYAARAGDELVRADRCDEAIRLARLLAALRPGDAAAEALLALLLLQDGRRAARLDDHGDLVLLADQDRNRWDHDQLAEGQRWLAAAAAHPTRTAAAAAHLLQAAIAAEHARAPSWAATDWPAIVDAYDQLLALTASPVVAVNRAVAVSFAAGPEAAAILLGELADDPRLAGSHALLVARADVDRRLGRTDAAIEHYRAARRLAPSAAERRFLGRRLAELSGRGAR